MNGYNFQIWKNDFLSNKKQYNDQVWKDTTGHPLDILLIKLAELYEEADESQRLVIENFLKENPNGLGNWSCSYVEPQNY